MTKFCSNCGAEMDDSARICGACGVPFDSANQPSMVTIEDPEKKAKTQKTVKTVGAAAVLLVILIIVIKIISGSTGYNGLIKKVMNAYEKYDVDTIISLSSDVYFFEMGDYAEYYFDSAVSHTLDSLESRLSGDYKFSYEVENTNELSNRQFDKILNEFTTSTDIVDIDIDKIVSADIKITAKSGKKTSTENITLVMSRESGSWKLLLIQM